jgi:hypothetical protein
MATFPQSSRYPGPPLLPVALAHIGVFIAGLIAAGMLSHGAKMAFPFEPVDAAVQYISQARSAVQASSFFQFAAAIPLGIFTAAVVSKSQFLGVKAAGSWIALFGGFAASFMMMLSGLCGWVVSSPGMAQWPGAIRTLQLLMFATGGPGVVAGLGLLMAGISITASFYRLLPRWLVWLGIALAVASELSSLTLLTWKVSLLLPIGRYLGFIWLIGVAVTLRRANAQKA